MVLIRSKAFVHLKLLLTLFRGPELVRRRGVASPAVTRSLEGGWRIFRKYNTGLASEDETEIQLNLLCMEIWRVRQVLIASTNCYIYSHLGRIKPPSAQVFYEIAL